VRLANNLEVEVTSLSPGTSVSKKMKSDQLDLIEIFTFLVLI
jgi:hypothetical protein